MLTKPRKLLVASLGVAAVSYACTRETPPGNLVAPQPTQTEVVGNLVAPIPQPDAGAPPSPIVASDAGKPTDTTSPGDAGKVGDAGRTGTSPTTIPTIQRPVGNLMPPPPPPSGKK